MKTLYRTAWVVLLLLAMAVVVLWASRPVHRFSPSDCQKCHLEDPEKGNPKLLRAPEEVLCSKCHPLFGDTITHPVGVEPVKTHIPPDMPLALDGTLTCSTCHIVHGQRLSIKGTETHLLRRTVTGVRFCIICHGQEVVLAMKGHVSGFQVVHYKPKYYVYDPLNPVDAVSGMCLSCHDGSVGSLTKVGMGYWRHSEDFFQQDAGLHPIGVDYRKATSLDRSLRPISSLDPRIKLVNGKVSCISCHDPYSTRPMMLVMSNRGSRLCLECHIK